MSAVAWKFGRGLLGKLQPLIGSWRFEGETQMGHAVCERVFAPVLNESYVELRATWNLPKGAYREIALFGKGDDGALSFWSFTSDGKHSAGALGDGSDVHEKAICFEAEMPAGRARMIYWPDAQEGFHFAVESQTKKGWNRFLEQHFRPAE